MKRPGGCLFGLECEFMAAATSEQGGRLPDTAGYLFELARQSQKHLPSGSSIFLSNGGRFYIDAGCHPEYATPECTSPDELVLHSRAGDLLLADLGRRLVADRAGVDRALISKCNVDYVNGTTWGCHENYLFRGDPSAFETQLVPHLVSRAIYTGAGGFDNRSAGLRFMVSPRVAHMQSVTSGESMNDRAILHNKNEPLCGPDYRRVHLLCGESLCSQRATWLKFGTTALILALLEAGVRLGVDVRLNSPVGAMSTFAEDEDCVARAPLVAGGDLSAVEIQRRYLEAVEANLDLGVLPHWASDVCREWRRVLDATQKDDASLDACLDWRIKRDLLRAHSEAQGLLWQDLPRWTRALESLDAALHEADLDDPVIAEAVLKRPYKRSVRKRIAAIADDLGNVGISLENDLSKVLRIRQQLFEIDVKFSQLGSDGIFGQLDAQGLLEHRVITDAAAQEALTRPPQTSRARLRGEWVQRLGDRSDCAATWSRVLDSKSRRYLNLDDPFEQSERWENLTPESDESVGILLGESPDFESLLRRATSSRRRLLAQFREIVGDVDPGDPD